MVKYLRIGPISIFFCLVFAFSDAQQVIGTGGGYYKNGIGSVSITLGEMAVQTYQTGSNIATEGFEQTFSSTLLPLSLLSFTANLVNAQTQLQWVTAQEVNTSYFDIERASTGSSFTKLLSVQSHDNAASENTYQAIDPSPLTGMDYYRLKEVDLDGKYTYSPVVFVKVTEGLSCTVYPNPAHDKVFISIECKDSKPVTMNLFDITGKMLTERQGQVTAGASLFSLDIQSFASGTYFLHFTGLDLPIVKIIKQ
jgi:hypothetical protein